MMTPDGLSHIVELFGDPTPYIGAGGHLDEAAWKADKLAYCTLPFPLPLDWNRSVTVTKILCHKLMAPVFENAFDQIVAANLQSAVKTYGGCYAYRPQRGGTKLSAHVWGIAIDLNPFENQQGTEGKMDQRVIEIFRAVGFRWGGDFAGKRTDPMHFQFCVNY